MKKSLTLVVLLAASGVSAFAATAQLNLYAGGKIETLNSNDYNTGWTYTSIQESNSGGNYDGQWHGNIGFDGVHNASGHPLHLTHHRQNMTIDLSLNARYEFSFSFNLAQNGAGSGDQAMAGMYLAGNNGSIFFGNAQLETTGNRRAAVAVKYNADIAEYNDNAGQKVYFPNGEFQYKVSSPYDYTAPVDQQWYTVVDGSEDNGFDTGTYRLEIIIESFSDQNREDVLYLYASTPDGTQNKWTNLKGLGFEHNAYFDAYGFVLHNDGNSIATADRASSYEYSRVVKTIPEPEVPPVLPDVPEPSAFGLLAGVGALAFVTSRRRRK